MNLNNVSVRRITTLTAMAVVVCFVTFYLVFKYLWTYDKQVKQALELQQEEVTRVETIIELSQIQMGDAMVDYAAWNDMVEFVQNPTEYFVEDSIGLHAYTSQVIHGFYVFSPDQELVWGRALDTVNNQLIETDRYSPFFPTILNEAEKLGTDTIEAIVRFIVIENEPYFAATTRVCNSDATGCNKGYIIFMKKLSAQFIDKVHQATGIRIELVPNEIIGHVPASVENISYISKRDYLGDPSVILKVFHRVKIPSFIVKQELFALFAFSVMFYFINLLLAKSLVKPITNANLVLEKFQAQGGIIPDESYFISKEMKGFARSINRIMSELEASREDLRWQSEHDPLTEISNRRHLEKRLTSLIEDYRYSFIALYLVDIDYFKLYNDNFSHLDGDNALKAVAKALNNVDYSGDKIVARFGGEEFCVVVASDEHIEIEQYAQLLIDAVADLEIAHPYSLLESKDNLSISIGGVLVHQPNIKNYQDFFHQADQALYVAKKRGRDQYVVRNYGPEDEAFAGIN